MKKAKKKESKVKYGTISLPMPLIEKIQRRIKGTGMSSVSAYVSFVLRQVLSSPESSDKNGILSREEELDLSKRLKALGY